MFIVLYRPQYLTFQTHKLPLVVVRTIQKVPQPVLWCRHRQQLGCNRLKVSIRAVSSYLQSNYCRFGLTLLLTATLILTIPVDGPLHNDWVCSAEGIERDLGKVGGGAASSGKTSTGVSRTVTRGVNLSGADFSEQDLSGVSFQQSLLRETDFHKAKLVSASFFGAELSYANLEDADLTEANLELANLRNANLKNAVLRRAYFSGNTRLENVNIEGADLSEVILRKDQKKYLCSIAKGTNSHTGVETKVSLGCSGN